MTRWCVRNTALIRTLVKARRSFSASHRLQRINFREEDVKPNLRSFGLTNEPNTVSIALDVISATVMRCVR